MPCTFKCRERVAQDDFSMPMIQKFRGRSHRDPDFIEMGIAIRVLLRELDRVREMTGSDAPLLDSLRLSVEHFEEVIEEYEAAEEAEAAGKDFKYRWVFPGKFDEPT
jgi:hypothetical protein